MRLLIWEQKQACSGLFSDPDRQEVILNVLTVRHVEASTGCALETSEREHPPPINFGPGSAFGLWQTSLASTNGIRTGHEHSSSLQGIQSQPPATRGSGNSQP